MATSVSGPLRLVTDQPAALVQVSVRAPRPRPHDGGMVVDFTTPASVEDGLVEFPCVPGPAVLSVMHAGVPQITVPLVVPDKASATLEECIRAAELADTATRSELEDLARRVVEGVSQAELSAAAAQESAAAADMDAREVTTARQIIDGYRQEVTTAHGETLAARDVAVGAAETATARAEEVAANAWSVVETSLYMDEVERNAAASEQEATRQADRAASEADRAGQAAEASSVKAVSDKVTELLAGAPEAYDTLLEIAEELQRGQTVESALTQAIAGKADKVHTHRSVDVLAANDKSLQAVLNDHEANLSELDALKSTKLDVSEVSPNEDAGKVVRRRNDGHIYSPKYSSTNQVMETLSLAPKALASLWAAQQIVMTELKKSAEQRPALFSGTGAPPTNIQGAVVGDWYLNESTMELHKITGV